MDLAISNDPDGRVGLVAHVAIARAGLELAPARGPHGSAWWRDGLGDAVERAPVRTDVSLSYDAARSPRRTRGATRA